MDKMTDKIKVKAFDNLFMRCQFGFGSRLVGLHKGKRWAIVSGSCWPAGEARGSAAFYAEPSGRLGNKTS